MHTLLFLKRMHCRFRPKIRQGINKSIGSGSLRRSKNRGVGDSLSCSRLAGVLPSPRQSVRPAPGVKSDWGGPPVLFKVDCHVESSDRLVRLSCLQPNLFGSGVSLTHASSARILSFEE